MIYSFSGTGNSAYVAKRIAEICHDKVTDLNSLLKKENQGSDTDVASPEAVKSVTEQDPVVTGTSAPENDTLVFCVPTYAWRIPRVVEEWIRRQSFTPGTKAWFVMTCGGQIGDAASFNRALCEEKGLTYMGTMQILMPENYIAMFNAPDKVTATDIVDKAEPDIDRAAQLIRGKSPFPAPRRNLFDILASRFINEPFYRFFLKDTPFTAGSSCTGCGACVRACPLNNITLTDGKPHWNGNCTHCMACITLCPQKSIEYGSKSIGKPRYRCPK